MSKVKLNKVKVKVSKVVIDKEDGIYREDKRNLLLVEFRLLS